MDSKEFLINELKKIHDKFPMCNFRYEIRESSMSHLIEVTPLEIYNSSNYMNAEDIVDEAFVSLFPNENLIFVSEDSLNKVSNPIFEIKSKSTKKQFRTLAELTSFSPVDMYPATDICSIINQAQMIDLNNFILVDMIQDEFVNVGNNNYALAA